MEDNFGGEVIGFLTGIIITIIICAFVGGDDKKQREHRIIEKNKGTYQEGNFIYFDKDLEYIITGNKE